jgi:hypothetical protein
MPSPRDAPTLAFLFDLAVGYGVPVCDLLCNPPPADPKPKRGKTR